jgi:hypothetical protein
MKLDKKQIKRIIKDHCRTFTVDGLEYLLNDKRIDYIAQELIEHEKEIIIK